MEDLVLNVKGACKFLGLSESTVRSLILDGIIPVAKVRGQYRFLRSRLEQWLNDMSDVSLKKTITESSEVISKKLWQKGVCN